MKDYFNTRESRMESRGCYEGSELDLNPFLLLCDLTQVSNLSKPMLLYLSNVNLNLHCKFAMPIK